MHDLTIAMLDEDENVDWLKEEVMNDSEIGRPDFMGVIPKKGGPSLATSRVLANAIDKLLNGGLTDLDAQLKQFTLYFLSCPE
jgi:hypothetical protein